MIPGFSQADGLAVLTFLVSAGVYHYLIEGKAMGGRSLNARMNVYRHRWMTEMLARDNRMVDVQVMAALHQGSAFFASTSLISVGGSLSLVRSGADLSDVLARLPFGAAPGQIMWEIKVIGLAIIFIYAFFKFAWAYRLFNYAAILMGAIPQTDKDTPEARLQARRVGDMTVVAGRHFNRGQRAFFFALAYLGWFLGPYVLIGTTIAALIVIARRQFASDALSAILEGLDPQETPPR